MLCGIYGVVLVVPLKGEGSAKNSTGGMGPGSMGLLPGFQS